MYMRNQYACAEGLERGKYPLQHPGYILLDLIGSARSNITYIISAEDFKSFFFSVV